MAMMVAGLLLFTGVHLFLSFTPAAAARLKESLGDNGRKGLVALFSAAGIALIVFGWRSTSPAWIYTPPPALHSVGLLVIAVSIYLFVVANRPSVVKRLLRHPQLTGVLLWCIGHLMLNGDSRSLLLFAWLGVWAIHEMLLINRRDGIWIKTDAPGVGAELVTLVVSVIALGFLAYVHVWLAGVAVLPQF